MTTDLLAELDAAAKAILDAANPKPAAEGEEPREPVSLQDRIKAFEVVGKYAQMREKLAPPETKPTQGSRFDDIRREFHDPTGGRRSRTKAKAKNGAAAGADALDNIDPAGTDEPAPTH